jgi:hypothetical protein
MMKNVVSGRKADEGVMDMDMDTGTDMGMGREVRRHEI